MLHHVTVRNFAYFKDEQTLNFDSGGHYLLIGENDSGKSSLFEIIRGCMGASKCTSLSKPHDQSKPSIAVCCFRDKDKKVPDVVSALIRPGQEKEDDSNDMYMKLVHVGSITGGAPEELEVEYTFSRSEAGEAAGINLKWESLSESMKLPILKRLSEKVIWYEHVEHILEVVSEHLKPETLNKSDESGFAEPINKCERLLKRHINKTTVVTFPMTGISTCQWTKSKLLKQDGKPSAVQEEIVTWYLKKLYAKHNKTSSGTPHDSRDEGKQAESLISGKEEEEEREYFSLITNNIGFDFSFCNETITVTNKAFPDNASKFQQIPEGIYEAKKLSVLLAVERFQTVCLEEPDRGMHPQMIERIRDLVLPQLKGKVVLITSHSPSFLSPATIPKVFYFRRHIDEELCTSTIVPLWPETKEHEKENEGKTSRIITSGQSPLLFFASNLLLVEGEGDYIFAAALKQLLLTDGETLQHYIDLTQGGEITTDEMKHFLCSLHILPMVGEANKIRYRRFCKRLGKESFFLMDFDVLKNNIPQFDKANPSSDLENFFKWFGIEHDERKRIEAPDDVIVLEKDGLFIWKGTIETATASFAEKHELKQFLKKNNVFLQYRDIRSAGRRDDGAKLQEGNQGKREKKKKIFSNKELTNENIRNVVQKIVKVSKDDDESEIRRLIMFLIKISVNKRR